MKTMEEVFSEGEAAFRAGKRSDENPYIEGDEAEGDRANEIFSTWYCGWDDARKESKK